MQQIPAAAPKSGAFSPLWCSHCCDLCIPNLSLSQNGTLATDAKVPLDPAGIRFRPSSQPDGYAPCRNEYCINIAVQRRWRGVGCVRRIANNMLTVLIVLMGVVGVGLLVYPTFSDWWNSMHQSYAIANYDQVVADLDEHHYDELLAKAEAYNAELAKTGVNWNMSEKDMRRYNSLLDVTGNGMMGYVEIPKIHITLPIYHGTRNAVLQVAIGHLSGTSLPVGGKSTHCSVSGHRGLPSARLFTDIDSLVEGDLFTITVLDRVMTYEVDQVRIVLPTELNDLAIESGQDYVTLVTCTPYGINSHRLLVRGHRTKGDLDVVLADAVRIEPGTIAVYMAIPVIVALVIWVLVITGRRSKRQRTAEEAAEEFRRRRVEREEKGAEPDVLPVAAGFDPTDAESAFGASAESVTPHEGG